MSVQPVSQASMHEEDRQRLASLERLVRRLRIRNGIALAVLWILTGIVILVFISVIIYLLVQGFSYLIKPGFYNASGDASIGAQLFNTFYILILSEIILIPISLAGAIYLVEYARQGPLVTAIHFAAETLAGVPSLVLGLFGYLAFGSLLGLGTTRLTGALTLLCLNLPLALRLYEDALTAVPRDFREGGLALGSTKWHMIRTIVLPSALPGIVTGIILSAGKIVGEAAALIFTMGTNNPGNVFTLNPLIGSDNLTIRIWFVQTVGAGAVPADAANAVSAGGAAVLIILLLIINLGARSIGRVIQRRVTAA
jgi:phosphate transport system permease protein